MRRNDINDKRLTYWIVTHPSKIPDPHTLNTLMDVFIVV